MVVGLGHGGRYMSRQSQPLALEEQEKREGARRDETALELLLGAEEEQEDRERLGMMTLGKGRHVKTVEVQKAGRRELIRMLPRALLTLGDLLDPEALVGRAGTKEANVSLKALELYFRVAGELVGLDNLTGPRIRDAAHRNPEVSDFTVRVVKDRDGAEGVEMTVRGR